MSRISRAVPAVVLLALVWAAPAFSAAGKVEGVSGTVQVERPGRPARALLQGMAVESGDTLVTGPASTLTVRMQNGESLIFRPDTRFVIETFRMPVWASEPATGRSFYSLVKGGFRAITSALKPRGLDSYRIKTPVATIGIRGTTLDVAFTDRLYAGVQKGAISISNSGGTLVLNAGQYAQVLNAATAPSLLGSAPAALGGGTAAAAGSSTAATGAGAAGATGSTGAAAGTAGAVSAAGTLSGTAIGLGTLGLIGVTAVIIGNDDDSSSTSTSTSTSTGP